MDMKLQYSVEDIFNKEFKIDFKGYSAQEVDTFLDEVISDYEKIENVIKHLGEKLQSYEAENERLKAQIIELEGKNSYTPTQNVSISNVDLIKRISRLEQEVFKNKEN